MLHYLIYSIDGQCFPADTVRKEDRGGILYTVVPTLPWNQISHIDAVPDCSPVSAGTDGWYLLPGGWGKCPVKEFAVGHFLPRADLDCVLRDAFIPLLGVCTTDAVKTEKTAFLAAARGMSMDCTPIVTVRNGTYAFCLRFAVDGESPYEIPSVVLFSFAGEDCTYSAMAKAYRTYQLARGFVRPLKDRLTPELSYAAESVCIRIRHAWKPVPCTVLEQTPGTEPPVHTACTFADAERIMEACHDAGIEKAEFCLVGWNIGGHDGRWPQMFPVEPSLGGKEGLRHLLAKAAEFGYHVVCHTNHTDAYSIAENFAPDDLVLDRSGAVSVEAEYWAGGRTYNICPGRLLAHAPGVFEKLTVLGFRGLHYTDVITCTAPRRCDNPLHPLDRGQVRDCFDRFFALAKESFGGAACEGAYEHYLHNVDYILYASFYREEQHTHPLCETYIPFWTLVYHGIILSNPYSSTVNACINSDRTRALKLTECGGRPAVYYYSRFVNDGTDWMGAEDFTMNTLSRDIPALKEQYDRFSSMAYLQYEFIESHEETSPGVFTVTYSDGSRVTVDYNTLAFRLERA